MKINRNILISIIVLLLLCIGGIQINHYFSMKDIEDSYESVIKFKEAEKSQLKNSLDLKVEDSRVMQQHIISQDVALSQFKKEFEGYKKINSYMKTEVISSIKNLEAKYNSTPKNEFDGIKIEDGGYISKKDVEKNFLRIPANFDYKDEWLSINGTISKKSTIIDSLGIFNKFDAIIGYKKSEKNFSWLRKKEPVLELKSYNPYTKITHVNNVVVDDKKGKAKNILLSTPAVFVYGLIGGSILLN